MTLDQRARGKTKQEEMLDWLELISAEERGKSYKAEMAQRALAYMRELEERLIDEQERDRP